MGLDTVELVMEIEEVFSIKIPDSEASKMQTVGDVFDYIVDKTDVQKDSGACLSAATFYSLRQAVNELGTSQRLRPGDSTSIILPSSGRSQYWNQLQNRCQLELPALCRPSWLVTTCAALVVTLSVLIGLLAYQSNSTHVLAVLSAILAGICLTMISSSATRPFAVCLASSCTTLRGLSESTLSLNFMTISERFHGASVNDLWVTLRSIIVDQLGVLPEEVRPDANFVNDLGCD